MGFMKLDDKFHYRNLLQFSSIKFTNQFKDLMGQLDGCICTEHLSYM